MEDAHISQVTLTNKQNIPSENNALNSIRQLMQVKQKKLIKNFEKINTFINNGGINNFAGSTIVEPEESEMISEWVCTQVGSPKTFEPLFNTRDHGFTAQAFHSICDEKGPTITFIETTTGKRFGGYSNSSWHNTNGNF